MKLRGAFSFLPVLLLVMTVTLFLLFENTVFSAPGRQKAIDFDDEVVEGMNKRPLDSVSQISEKDKRKRKQHLYKKRASFRNETAETLRELRYIQ
ncbi:MAG: hypothetical protein A3K03_11845 [Bdellovibrionales bacterium RIFOXYD1_FULL_44_7]|nr:MAG: hypothetical protein A3K03_11845 [Bdellovibrionales bacterium RIFOXYD1_FULL_44_7]